MGDVRGAPGTEWDGHVLLLHRTEGWAVALRLAAGFLADTHEQRSIADFTGDVLGGADYLTDEVLSGQPSATRRFLLYTSICENICGDLADALTLGAGGGQKTLEELERGHHFVVRLGPQPRWFSYHHLVHQIGQGAGFRIKSRHRRQDDGAHFRQRHEAAQVTQMPRRLAHHQDQRPALLQHHIGGAGQAVGGHAGGDLAHAAHRTGRHQHALGAEAAAGDGRGNIGHRVAEVRLGGNLLGR